VASFLLLALLSSVAVGHGEQQHKRHADKVLRHPMAGLPYPVALDCRRLKNFSAALDNSVESRFLDLTQVVEYSKWNFATQPRFARSEGEALAVGKAAASWFDTLYKSGKEFDKQRFWGRQIVKDSPDEIFASGASGPEMAVTLLASLNSVVDWLKAVLHKDTVTLVDLPCGDFHFMRTFVRSRPDVKYLGIDLSTAVTDRLQAKFGSPRVQFRQHDIVAGVPELPWGEEIDLLHNREMLQHIPIEQSLAALQNMQKMGPKYMLVTTHPSAVENRDIIRAGGFSARNLMLPPYFHGTPLCWSKDMDAKQGLESVNALWSVPIPKYTPLWGKGSVKETTSVKLWKSAGHGGLRGQSEVVD